ncbi:hypothetical protein EIP91_006900 [Steccherinum ochraceum]|uniref:Uncharacterized protein n=1 Tax=Steccherinum ochraceum TaxID=92696 RepID=A0A4R0RFK5_9APHY|nr:hypothetical protein EIP91_006900 [Steccherinum ochraceum]
MTLKLPTYRLPHEEEPLRTDDIFTMTCLIRDELQKMEDRCVNAQAKGEELKQKRSEISEARTELETLEQAQPTGRTPADTSQGTFLSGLTSLLSEFSDADSMQSTGTFSELQSAMSTLPRLPDPSVNSHKATLSASWRQKFASLVRDPKDESYVSLSSTDGTDNASSAVKDKISPTVSAIEGKEGSRVLGVVTALKTNVANSLDMGTKRGKKGEAKPKYVGGSSLKKTFPHKARRQTRKPFVPDVFSKARFSVMRKTMVHSPRGVDIGTPFDARKVHGTSSHLGEPTMEPLKGSEAFTSGSPNSLDLDSSSAMTGLDD